MAGVATIGSRRRGARADAKRARRPPDRVFAAAAALGLVASFAACGGPASVGSGRPADETANPSAVHAEEPPILFSNVVFGAVTCRANFDKSVVRMGRPGDAEDRLLRIPSYGVLGMATVPFGGTLHLLLAERDERSRLTLSRVHDLDGDGFPDEASRVVLLTSGDEPLHVSSIAARAASTLYLLDSRCGDVLVAVDADGDGWADRLNPRRFARSDDHPDLVLPKLRYERDATTGAHRVLATHELGEHDGPLRFPYRVLFDLDDDGVSERSEMVAPIDRRPTVLRHAIVEGDPSIGVGRDPRAGSTLIELWRLAADGADLELVGSLPLAAGVATGELVPTRPLVAGTRVAVRTAGDRATEVRLTVSPAWPTLEAVEPDTIPAGAEARLALRGRRFAAGMTVRRMVPGASEDVAVTVESASHATIVLSKEQTSGPFGLVVLGPGQPTDDPMVPVRLIQIRVRSP